MAEIGWLLLKDSSPCSKQRRSLTGTSVLLKLPKQRLAEGSAFRLSKLLCCRSVQFSSVQSSPVQFGSVQFSSVQFKGTNTFGSVSPYILDRRIYGLVGWFIS